MLPDFFNNHSTKLDSVRSYNTRQKTQSDFLQYSVASESRKTLYHIGLKVWRKVSKHFVFAHFQLLKNALKLIPC